MSLDALIMLAGALVAVMPFLGFPLSWQVWIIFLLGVIIIGLGIAVRRKGAQVPERKQSRGYVESAPRTDEEM
ncbi:MAG TPA: hypothetical protein VMU27_01075 [Candidatus Paceibacterota bacterium]|nr:hypothetical protein [Candidatus Paceibacterota bacterium]